MPNFDGNGPLKRGRVIGRGLGPCNRNAAACARKDSQKESRSESGQPAQ
jgi:hypothetical protein